MICRPIPGGFVCTSGRRTTCQVPGCSKRTAALCDHPVTSHKSGTCDMRMCADHRHPIGPNRDLCPAHKAFTERQAAAESSPKVSPDPAKVTVSETSPKLSAPRAQLRLL